MLGLILPQPSLPHAAGAGGRVRNTGPAAGPCIYPLHHLLSCSAGSRVKCHCSPVGDSHLM